MTVLPTSTAAVRVHAHGGPGQLVHEELPLPPLGPTDVLVEVDTAAVSGWDLKYRRGLQPGTQLPGRAPFPLPHQLGREGSGTVIATGSDARQLRPGDRVVLAAHPENPHARETYRGLGNLSTGVALPGHQAPGSYAAYLARDQQLFLPVPDHVDLEQAAVTLASYGTSHRILRDRLRVTAGDFLLVTGAAGPMGWATIQLAHLFGLRPIATTRHAARADALRAACGDDVVVTDDLEAAAEAIRDLTHGQGVDHAVDYSTSRDLLRLALDALRLGGRLCPAAGEQNPPGPMPFTVFDLTRLEADIVGARGARHDDALRVMALLAAGKLHSPIAARFPLAKAAEAHEFMERGSDVVGRVVLKPGA
ncbi:zinc-binding alcohol dehydrogenase family protein [Streptomyces sp. NBC_00878]|uniref:quinone oxidoreductase family protein n=1 Tax=Streptomyces sp. NBC_00878 TaxID=2975854 RepID=UPI002252B75A|nr:zinc-binding alcohol dehydrogenase family protein [Streptomyces sp. NBC_00878]MCX4904651.1 zinc-binding alcohol dehydrogenase family protein [Streptomyces sp. NBC_00878]